MAPGIAISMAPLCNRYKRQGQARVGGRLILTQTQLHEIIQILCASHLAAYYLVVSASEIQTAWLTTPLDNSFSSLKVWKVQLACSSSQAPLGASYKPTFWPGNWSLRSSGFYRVSCLVTYSCLLSSLQGTLSVSWLLSYGDFALWFTTSATWPLQDNWYLMFRSAVISWAHTDYSAKFPKVRNKSLKSTTSKNMKMHASQLRVSV